MSCNFWLAKLIKTNQSQTGVFHLFAKKTILTKFIPHKTTVFLKKWFTFGSRL